jgi:acyl-coenzyme A thioesterase PaaI-like protein
MKIADKIKDLQPLNMELYDGSFVSGKQQDYIQLQYYFDKVTSKLITKIYFTKNAQGAPLRVHGGAISAVLDETMGIITFLNFSPAVTANLSINFIKPLKVEKDVFVETWIEENNDKKYLIKGIMVTEDETLVAEASGVFIKMPMDKVAEYQDYYRKFKADLE